LFFANRGHLQALKVRDLKFYVRVNCTVSKTAKSKSEFKLKKNIGQGMKMFRKYQLAVWLSIQNFYSHITKVARNYECFGRIVEPCKLALQLAVQSMSITTKMVSSNPVHC